MVDVDWGEHEAVRVLSILLGDNTDSIIFNLQYLNEHNPNLAEEVRKLQDKLKYLGPGSEFKGHEEDISLIKRKFQKLAWEAMESRHEELSH